MSQKNCLILTNNLHGLYNFRKEVVHAILEAGVAVYISAPEDMETSVYFKKIGCQIVITNIDRRGMNPLKDLKLLFHYIKLLRSIKPSFVLGYTIKPNIYGGLACRLCHIPFLPNVTGLGSAVENPGFYNQSLLFFIKSPLKKPTLFSFKMRRIKSFVYQKD